MAEPQELLAVAVDVVRAGPEKALEQAFGRRRTRHTEAAWRSHLARLAEGAPRTRRIR